MVRLALLAPPQQRHLERPQLAAREAAGEDGVLVHDPPRALLVRRLEDRDPGVDVAERRAGQDERPLVEQALEALEVHAPDGLLLVGHRGGEVLARGMDEVDPRQHLLAPLGYADCGRRRPARATTRASHVRNGSDRLWELSNDGGCLCRAWTV